MNNAAPDLRGLRSVWVMATKPTHILTALRQLSCQGQTYVPNQTFEFEGTSKELEELVERDLVRVEEGKIFARDHDAVKSAQEIGQQRAELKAHKDRIDELEKEVGTLKAEQQIMSAFASELRGMLAIGPDDSILVAVKALAEKQEAKPKTEEKDK